MKIKKINPVTSAQRNLIKLDNRCLRKFPFIKTQTIGSKNSAGRNNLGQITSFRKGGGHKQKYRKIDFYRRDNSTGIVVGIEYDPNRTANIASIYDFLNVNYYYILAPRNLKIGDIVKSGLDAESKTGHSLPISKIPVGSYIHNISVKSQKKGQLSRSAGAFSQLIEKSSKYGRIRLNSGEQRFLEASCNATIGIVSNEFSFITTLGKAGRSRWLNKRPSVRGVAMNPIDHPHGGGEGKTSGGRTSVTPWGKPAKNRKTSRSRNNLIISNRKDIKNE